MPEDAFKKLSERINESKLHKGEKEELAKLLDTLKGEVQKVEDKDGEKIKTIMNFTEASTHEALRTNKEPALQELALKALQRSVEEFEMKHPDLVRVVNRISMMLSNIGI